MLRLHISLLLFAVLLAVLATPAPAAERFAGITERGQLVGFTSENPYALTMPLTVRGLAAGERLLALGQGARGVVAVGTSARLYAVDVPTARATAIGPAFAQGLRGSRFSLAVAPRGDRARLLSDVGQDLVVDLATGVAKDGPGLRRARDGSPVRPAADMTPDGSLVGVQLHPDVLLRELVRGSTTMAELPLATPEGIPLSEPVSFTLGSDGNGYVIAVASDRERNRQSVLTIINPSTGKRVGTESSSVDYFGRRISAATALGQGAPDRTPPRARVVLPKRVSARALLGRRELPLRVRSSEAAQVTVRMQVRGEAAGFTFDIRDTPGMFRFTNYGLTRRDKARIRAGAGARLRFRIRINDLKGNDRRVVRTVRLTR